VLESSILKWKPLIGGGGGISKQIIRILPSYEDVEIEKVNDNEFTKNKTIKFLEMTRHNYDDWRG